MTDFTNHKTEDGRHVIRLLSRLGFPNHRIASLFDVNQGRISEINNGQSKAVSN